MVRIIGFAAVLLCGMLAASAQETTAPSSQGSFTSSTELVLVPAVVTDRSGAHVRGLTKDAFHVFDNGREQKIAVFEEVSASGSTLQITPPQNGIYSNHVVSGDPATTLCIVLIDALNAGAATQYWTIRSTLELIDRWDHSRGLKQPVLVALLTSRGLQIVHEATTDPKVLVGALARLKLATTPREGTAPAIVTTGPIAANNGALVAPPPPPSRGGDNYAEQSGEATREATVLEQFMRSDQMVTQLDRDTTAHTTFWAVQAIANAVAGIPGRKALIWVSSYFPFELRPTAGGSPQWAKVWTGVGDESHDVSDLREQVVNDLVRAGVSVYPVLASGLMVSPEFSVTWENDAVNRMIMRPADAARRAQAAEQGGSQGARLVADATAGRACVNTNDIADCIDRAVDDAGHYYLLAFTPDPRPKDSGARRLKLDVGGDHLTVRARDHYFYGPDPGAKNSAKEATDFAIGANLGFLGLPIAVKWLDVKPSGTGKSTVRFVIGVDGRSISIDERHSNHVNLNLGIQAAPGTQALLQTISTDLKPDKVDAIRNSQLTQTGAVELPVGDYSVRFVMRDNASGRIGSVVVPLRIQ